MWLSAVSVILDTLSSQSLNTWRCFLISVCDERLVTCLCHPADGVIHWEATQTRIASLTCSGCCARCWAVLPRPRFSRRDARNWATLTLSPRFVFHDRVEATPMTWHLAPGIRIVTEDPALKRDWASFGIVSSSSWGGFYYENLATLVCYCLSWCKHCEICLSEEID